MFWDGLFEVESVEELAPQGAWPEARVTLFRIYSAGTLRPAPAEGDDETSPGWNRVVLRVVGAGPYPEKGAKLVLSLHTPLGLRKED